MRRTPLTGAFCALLWILAVPGAALAETLDDYLGFRCGVDSTGAPELTLIYPRFGGEILQRAASWQSADLGDSKFTTLLWFLGAWHDPRGRELAEEVIAGNRGHHPQTLCAGIATDPDWAGLRLLIESAAFGDQPLRDAVLTMLAEVDFAAPDLAVATGRAERDHLLAEVGALRQLETDARLLGYVDTIYTGLAGIVFPAGGE